MFVKWKDIENYRYDGQDTQLNFSIFFVMPQYQSKSLMLLLSTLEWSDLITASFSIQCSRPNFQSFLSRYLSINLELQLNTRATVRNQNMTVSWYLDFFQEVSVNELHLANFDFS